MPLPTDARATGARLYFLFVETRTPLKFGAETFTSVTCARARLTLRDGLGREARGWGETPLCVQWVWPGALSVAERAVALEDFCRLLCEAWAEFDGVGHPSGTVSATRRRGGPFEPPGAGFGYRIDEIQRRRPEPAAVCE